MRNGETKSESLPPTTAAMMVNRTMSLPVVLVIMAVLLFSSFYPQPLVPSAMNVLLTICALASATTALLCRQTPAGAHSIYWDVAAVLFFLALGAGMLSGPEAVKANLQALDTPAATSSPTY